MATLNGRNGRVTIGDDADEKVILELTSWNLDITADELDTGSFGSTWGKSDVGVKKWSGSATGMYDPTDTDGQGALEAAFESGELIKDIKFYSKWSDTPSDSIHYHAPDSATDPNAGIRVTGVSPSAEFAGMVSINFTFSGSGPVKGFTETVPAS